MLSGSTAVGNTDDGEQEEGEGRRRVPGAGGGGGRQLGAGGAWRRRKRGLLLLWPRRRETGRDERLVSCDVPRRARPVLASVRAGPHPRDSSHWAEPAATKHRFLGCSIAPVLDPFSSKPRSEFWLVLLLNQPFF